MKRVMISIMILAALGFGIPCANAEISKDLDPMVSPDPQATVTDESAIKSPVAGETSNMVSTADATVSGKKADSKTMEEKKANEKKISEKKKMKSKKSSAKKSSSKKSSKSSFKKSSKIAHSSY